MENEPAVGQTISASQLQSLAGAPQGSSFRAPGGIAPSVANPPSILQKIQSVGKSIAKPFVGVGVSAYDLGSGLVQGGKDLSQGKGFGQADQDLASNLFSPRTVDGHIAQPVITPTEYNDVTSNNGGKILQGAGQIAGSGVQIGSTLAGGEDLMSSIGEGIGSKLGLADEPFQAAADEAPVAKTTGQKILQVARNANEAGTYAGVGNAGNTAADPNTYSNGGKQAVKQIGKSAVEGYGLGAATGVALTGAGMAANGIHNSLSTNDLTDLFRSTKAPEVPDEGINLKQQAVNRAEQDLAEAKQNATNPKDINIKQSALTRAQQDLEDAKNNVNESTSKLTAAQQTAKDTEDKLTAAQQARGEATPKAVAGYDGIVENVTGNKSVLGTKFAQDTADLEKSDPTLKLNLTNDQVSALRDLKESKQFTLPNSVANKTDAGQAYIGGQPIGGNLQAKINKALGNVGKETSTSLTPTEAQELIAQLNRGTFTRAADGSLHVNQQMIDVAQDIKNSASQAFGKPWDQIYSNYSRGINAVNKLDDIVNLSKDATATDANKSLGAIQKLSKTPEGKAILQNAIEDYKNVTKATTGKAIDLSDHVSAIQRVQELQDAIEQHQAELESNQKDVASATKAVEKAKSDVASAKRTLEIAQEAHEGQVTKATENAQEAVKRAQRRLDIARDNLQAQEEEKAALEKKTANRGFLEKHPQGRVVTRIAERALIGGGIIYPAIRAIEAALKKK